MNKCIRLVLLVIAMSAVAMANEHYHPGPPSRGAAPEIDPVSGASGLALVSGIFVLIHGRRKGVKKASKGLETLIV